MRPAEADAIEVLDIIAQCVAEHCLDLQEPSFEADHNSGELIFDYGNNTYAISAADVRLIDTCPE